MGAEVVEAVSWRGRVFRFVNEEGTWTQTTMPARPYQLREESGGYRLANPRAQRIYTFDSDGKLTKVEDGQGNELTLTYDSGGQLTEVSDGLGRTLTFSYSGGRLASVSDGSRTVQFGYTDGLLTSATDPLSNRVTYSYDEGHSFTGLLTEKTRAGGNTVLTQSYDGAGRVASQTDAFGNTTRFEYSTDEETGRRTTTVTDPMGNATEHVHDFRGRLLSVTDAKGQTLDLGYTDAGQRDQVTDREGDATQYTYDPASHLPTSITDAQGGKTTLSYTSRTDEGFTFQELSGVDRPDGTSIDYSYDADGNLTSVTGPAGGTWTLTYNDRGQPLTVTNPEGGTTTYTYNGDGTLASVEDPAGNTTTYSYDALRRPVSITRPDGATRTFSYDDADRLTSMTDEEGRTYNFSYDANGNLTEITDPAGRTFQRSYDAMGRLTQAEYTSSKGLAYQYDAAGNVTGVEPVKVLPVELASFEGVADGNDVLLTWKTASEQNNAGFEVQHRPHVASDGRPTKSWQRVGFVEGAGTTTEPQSYEHRVTGLASGVHLFRLKQIDLDGSATLSAEIEVALGVPDRFALHAAYPNPAGEGATIPFYVPRRARVRLAIYDVLGRRVATLVDAERAPGEHVVRLNASRLAGGVYFYRIRMGDFRATKKLVVLR